MTFRSVGERVVHDGHLRLLIGTFESDDGTTFEREIIRSRGAVAMVPIDDEGRVVLVRQFRAAIGDDLLEIPAGLLDVDGEDEVACARRELAEEVGLAAGSWQLLTRFLNSAGSSDQVTRIYLARELTDVPDSRQGIEELAMTVERLPLEEAVAMVHAGEITDAKTIIGLLMATGVL